MECFQDAVLTQECDALLDELCSEVSVDDSLQRPTPTCCSKVSECAELVEPEALLCPITRVMFRDPVFVPESGNTYDRSALERFWSQEIASQVRDPSTNCSLKSRAVYTNWDKRREIQGFLEAHKDYTPHGWPNRDLESPSDNQVSADEPEVHESTAKRGRGGDTVYVLDVGLKMDSADFSELKEAALRLIASNRTAARNSPFPAENVALFSYSTTGTSKKLCNFTCDYDLLEKKIKELQQETSASTERSALREAIEMAGNYSLHHGGTIVCGPRKREIHPRLVLFTDGQVLERGEKSEEEQTDVLRLARCIGPEGKLRGNVPRVISVACVVSGAPTAEDKEFLSTLVKITGNAGGVVGTREDLTVIEKHFHTELQAAASGSCAVPFGKMEEFEALMQKLMEEAGPEGMDKHKEDLMKLLQEHAADGHDVERMLEAVAMTTAKKQAKRMKELHKRTKPITEGNLQTGMHVRLKSAVTQPRYGWGRVKHTSVGVLRGGCPEGFVVDFPESDGFVVATHEIEVDEVASEIKVGSQVRVKQSVERPRYAWGAVTHETVGVVTKVKGDGHVKVNFGPKAQKWRGMLCELESIPVEPAPSQMSTLESRTTTDDSMEKAGGFEECPSPSSRDSEPEIMIPCDKCQVSFEPLDDSSRESSSVCAACKEKQASNEALALKYPAHALGTIQNLKGAAHYNGRQVEFQSISESGRVRVSLVYQGQLKTVDLKPENISVPGLV